MIGRWATYVDFELRLCSQTMVLAGGEKRKRHPSTEDYDDNNDEVAHKDGKCLKYDREHALTTLRCSLTTISCS
jgi:hypothetical protein